MPEGDSTMLFTPSYSPAMTLAGPAELNVLRDRDLFRGIVVAHPAQNPDCLFPGLWPEPFFQVLVLLPPEPFDAGSGVGQRVVADDLLECESIQQQFSRANEVPARRIVRKRVHLETRERHAAAHGNRQNTARSHREIIQA